MPEGVRVPPALYETGASIVVMMKCTGCGNVMRQMAKMNAAAVMSPDQALDAFETFGTVADAKKRSKG
jgi:uroporphyrinogen-III decarboxylase